MKKLLVLGANGQLGSDLGAICRVRRQQVEAAFLTRKNIDVARVEDIASALSDYEFDVLVNCTSYHKTDEVERNASLAFAINAHAVRALAEVCRDKGADFIHISTDYVFSGDAKRAYVETDAPRPINVYGASKAMGEVLAGMAHDRVYVLRVASLFGVAGASGKGGNFVETMLRLAKEKGEVRVVDDIVMSPTSTADVAEVILALIERKPEPGVYHAVNSGEASWFEFAREIFRRAGTNARVVAIPSSEYPTPARRPAYSVLDNGKLASVIGKIPHWADALDRYLRLKQHIA